MLIMGAAGRMTGQWFNLFMVSQLPDRSLYCQTVWYRGSGRRGQLVFTHDDIMIDLPLFISHTLLHWYFIGLKPITRGPLWQSNSRLPHTALRRI